MQCVTYFVGQDHIQVLVDQGKVCTVLEGTVDVASEIYSHIRISFDNGQTDGVVRIIVPSESFAKLLPLVPLCQSFPTVSWSFVSLEDILLRYHDADCVKALGHTWEKNGEFWQKVEESASASVLSELDILALYTNQPKKTYPVYAKNSDEPLEMKDHRLLESTKIHLFAIVLAAFPDLPKKMSTQEISCVLGFRPPKMGSVFFQHSRGFIGLQGQRYQLLESTERQLVAEWANILITNYKMKPIAQFSNIGKEV